MRDALSCDALLCANGRCVTSWSILIERSRGQAIDDVYDVQLHSRFPDASPLPLCIKTGSLWKLDKTQIPWPSWPTDLCPADGQVRQLRCWRRRPWWWPRRRT